jgi:hypothetical protein
VTPATRRRFGWPHRDTGARFIVAGPRDRQPGDMNSRPAISLPKGRRKMLGKIWTSLFVAYSAAAVPLFVWALASLA